MGLTISSGILVDFKDNEPEAFEAYKAIFENINTILAKNGVAPYEEPIEMNKEPLQFGGFPYSFLHHLRRFAAHVWEQKDNENWDWTPTPFSIDDEPGADAILEEHYTYMSSHLLTHSDAEGFYLPVELPEVLFDTEEAPVPGAMIGSSYDLLSELKSLTAHLGIGLDENDNLTNVDELNAIITNEDNFWIEILVCVTLIDAAKFSIQNKTAILFN
ncbi:hypothetical protein SAMN04488096_11051 [Mesonia phycicola]|uniref:Uncharacterized protein n=1 Tax=Mesonia phycicola TaxID=579105 RepID=A0A1M6HBS5_9FLAO|nr:hypothetical protein [Mesonia phycicola]SHJ19697.1 hypothetical protein SAMN04488096_11051 [Mesonia phycicola]